MDVILEYASNVIDITSAVLDHAHGLTPFHVKNVETIHRRSLEFVNEYMDKRMLPVQELRRYLSHDAMSPVTVIIGYCELMLMDNMRQEVAPAYIEAFLEIADFGYAIQEEVKTFHAQVWEFMQALGIPK